MTPTKTLLLLALLAGGCLDAATTKNNGTGGGGDAAIPESYIRAEPHGRLVFELDTVEGVAPRQASLNYAAERLGAVLEKPDGLEWTADETISSRGADHVWTFEELETLADETFDLEVDDGTAKIHVIYVDGSYENENVLGVAWANRHLVMFSGTLESSCDRPLVGESLCEVAESSVLLHELGHVVGLVDNGVEMVEPHADEEHGAHDESDECVMYWAYEGVGVIDVLASRLTGSSPELDFGPNCKADLAAVASSSQ